jgi:dihydrofolate reductase
MISLIAAIGGNNEIGKGNTLLWHMPADMKYFKEITLAHSVVMGRKTFESMGKILPNRRNIVISRDVKYKAPGVEVAHSLSEALDLVGNNEEEVFVIGGGELYEQTMPIADKLYITHIDAEDSEADAFFPEIIPIVWNEISHKEYKADDKNPFNYTFSVYDRFI